MKIRLTHQQPKLRLHDLLRKRKLTFAAWLAESNVSSYAELVRWCQLVGVAPPTEKEWLALRPEPVTAPADGVVVLEPPPDALRKARKRAKEETLSGSVG